MSTGQKRRVRVDISSGVSEQGGRKVEGVEACCIRCKHKEVCGGVSGGSVRRALALLRANCPRGEHNRYVTSNPEDMLD
jgi:hypothetical protein